MAIAFRPILTREEKSAGLLLAIAKGGALISTVIAVVGKVAEFFPLFEEAGRIVGQGGCMGLMNCAMLADYAVYRGVICAEVPNVELAKKGKELAQMILVLLIASYPCFKDDKVSDRFIEMGVIFAGMCYVFSRLGYQIGRAHNRRF